MAKSRPGDSPAGTQPQGASPPYSRLRRHIPQSRRGPPCWRAIPSPALPGARPARRCQGRYRVLARLAHRRHAPCGRRLSASDARVPGLARAGGRPPDRRGGRAGGRRQAGSLAGAGRSARRPTALAPPVRPRSGGLRRALWLPPVLAGRGTAGAGLQPRAQRPFWPHLTLARVKRDRPASPLQAERLPAPFVAHRVVLFRSILRPQGALYEPLWTTTLTS